MILDLRHGRLPRHLPPPYRATFLVAALKILWPLENSLFGHTRTRESILSTMIFTKRVQPCLWLSWFPIWSSGWSEWLSLVKVVVMVVLVNVACVYVGGCWPSSCAVW